jgi:prevent-host-death family protein
MIHVSAADFKNNTGRYQDLALREPIVVTKHDRPTYVLMSFESFHKINGGAYPIALLVAALSDAELEAISKAEVPAEYAYLDELLKEDELLEE